MIEPIEPPKTIEPMTCWTYEQLIKLAAGIASGYAARFGYVDSYSGKIVLKAIDNEIETRENKEPV